MDHTKKGCTHKRVGKPGAGMQPHVHAASQGHRADSGVFHLNHVIAAAAAAAAAVQRPQRCVGGKEELNDQAGGGGKGRGGGEYSRVGVGIRSKMATHHM